MILPGGEKVAGREFCEQHVQRGPPLQTNNLAALLSERLLRSLASPSELCGSGGNAAKQVTHSGPARNPATGGTGGRGPLTLGLGWGAGESPGSTDITQPHPARSGNCFGCRMLSRAQWYREQATRS
jgi:hypothetical protein